MHLYVCLRVYVCTNVMPSHMYSMFRPDNGVVADLCRGLHDFERQGLFVSVVAAPHCCVLIELAVYHRARQLTLSINEHIITW